MIFTSLMLIAVLGVFAQDGTTATSTAIDLGTFAGITALVSAIVTQILKVIPAIADSKIAKIGISAGVGAILCIVCWLLGVSEPLSGLVWWQALIYGIAAGLSGCGFYDLIKAIGGLFKKDTETA